MPFKRTAFGSGGLPRAAQGGLPLWKRGRSCAALHEARLTQQTLEDERSVQCQSECWVMPS